MWQSPIRRALSLCSALVFALAILTTSLASPGAAGQTQQSDAQTTPNPYGWRKLARFPTGTSASFTGIMSVAPSSGSWAAYTTSYYACGHCGFVKRDIVLHNVLDDREITIKGSSSRNTFSGDPFGIANVTYVEPYLLWYQPGPQAGMPNSHSPGQFECTVCYYNTAVSKGGSISDLLPDLTIMDDATGRTVPIARDQTSNGRALFSVQKLGANRMPVSTTLFLGNVNTAVLTPITLQGTALMIPEAAMHGDAIGWTQIASLNEGARNLYHYNPATGTVTRAQVPDSSNIYSLRAGTNAIFFSLAGPNNVQRYDLTTNTLTQVPNTLPYNFDVYGTRLARSGPNKGQVTLVELNGNRTIATWTVATAEEMRDSLNVSTTPSLSADKLIFSINGVGSTGTLHAHHLGIAWLDTPNVQFAKVWAKADQPVAEGKAQRSWLWGPAANYTGWEPYAGLPGDKRQVQYYDKSRMEVNNPDANPNDPFFVTNGLLVVEMVAGEVRLGETEVRASTAATLTVAGDPRKDNPLTPSYGALRGVASVKGDNKAPDRTGQFVSEAMDVNGTVSTERDNARAARYVNYVPQTGHNIPDLFNTYLQRMQAEYGYDWTFAMGYPITEAYWTKMRVGGKDYPVLIQAYQRRVMTYTPAFPAAWRVQQGNVGQHYFEWRYTLSKLDK